LVVLREKPTSPMLTCLLLMHQTRLLRLPNNKSQRRLLLTTLSRPALMQIQLHALTKPTRPLSKIKRDSPLNKQRSRMRLTVTVRLPRKVRLHYSSNRVKK
jgi:hypothetical protein